MILNIFCIFFKTFKVIISRNIEIHDRKIGQIDILHIGIARQVIGQILSCFINSILYSLLCILNIHIRIKFCSNYREVLIRIRCYFLETRSRFQLFFNLFSYQILHVCRRSSGIHGLNKYFRYNYLRKIFFWQAQIGKITDDRNDNSKYINCCSIINCPTGGFKFFFNVFHVFLNY